jgi:hypothetical protein
MFIPELLRKQPDKPPWMLDLSLWYAWHSKHRSLPSSWSELSEVEIANLLGAFGWQQVKPWRVTYKGVEIQIEETNETKIVHYGIGNRELTTSWTLGPDGDWWQTEHLVNTADDLKGALELVESINYLVEEHALKIIEDADDKSILAIELPHRPLSALLHDFLGWGEGLLMLRDFEDQIDRLLSMLDKQMHLLVGKLVNLPAAVMLSPDNLDGQYISPDLFERYLKPSYRQTKTILNGTGKSLVVHVGGPMKRLLKPLADAGVDVVEGVSGPPQSDVPLEEARVLAGPDLTLWGGIPQDWLLEATTEEEFRAGVSKAIEEVLADGGMILGVADRVPIAAELDRLEQLGSMIGSYTA